MRGMVREGNANIIRRKGMRFDGVDRFKSDVLGVKG